MTTSFETHQHVSETQESSPSLRVIGYARVSTEGQGESGAGLESQRVLIEAECERRGWQLARVEQDVLSGKTLKRAWSAGGAGVVSVG